MANELEQKGICATIIQNLRESCEIDWYLQAQLAYNMRFGDKHSVDESIDSKLNKKVVQKEQAKRVRFLANRSYSN